MPTYDYRCNACGHQFDELQSFTDPPLTKCPKCKKKKLERLFGGGGAIIFKGSGFYETDYRRAGTNGQNGQGEGTKTESTDAKAEASTSSTAGDTTKPETKSEGKGESKPGGGSKKKGK
jgi:putative FmdB family regulatory protein